MADIDSRSGFEKFCGGEFWDYELSWNTTTPDFTTCFQRTAVVWPPCFFLWLTLPIYAVYLHRCKDPSITANKLNTAKTILGVVLVLLAFLGLVEGSTEYANSDEKAAVVLVSPAILALTMILATVLIQVERQKGLITSGILFIFWASSFFLGLIPLYSYSLKASQMGYVQDVFRFSIFIPYYIIIIIQLVLSCIAEHLPQSTEDPNKKPSPEASSSFLSRVTFWWISTLVYVGYKKSLEESDLWELHPRDLSKYNGPILEEAWEKELSSCNWVEKKVPPRSRRTSSYQNQNGYASLSHTNSRSNSKKISAGLLDADEKTPLMSSTDEAMVEIQTGEKKMPSFFKVVTMVYGRDLLMAQLCKLVYDILVFTGPILQGYLISYTEDLSMAEWKGFLYASGFFACGVVQSLFFHQLFHIGMTCGMRMKSAVIAVVYKKALTMSNEARKNVTVGEIVNLMSVDAQRLQDVAGYIWMVWSSPLQIAISVYMLWGIVGPSVLTGLAVMILLIPINGVMATYQRKLQISQMTLKDQRIKLMNEVLNGIKVLKLYAWELSFKEKINAIREIELATLKKYSYLSAFGTFTWTCAPFIVTLATFATYVALGNTLDANTAFVSLSLFNILRFPINLLPMMISYLVTASVSIKRIGKFLSQGDIDFTNTTHDPRAEDPITIKNGTFSWGRDDDDLTILNNINFSVKDGGLVAVVGTVGSGKSSLISAILGEMEKLDGDVNVRGNIAYVPQQAWIQNATLRDNILFGKRFSKNKYENVISDSALKPDLEILPGGDQVEIGEKGINLSGGQKQRISLARAIYNDADIYLLDDPLSAVDSHVGKHIFEKVISNETGALKGKTRILVTHGLHWLPKVDQVFVIEHGRISETGTYDELLQHNGAFAQLAKQYLTQELDSEEEMDSDIEEEKRRLLERVESVVDEDAKHELQRLSSTGSPAGTATGTDSETPDTVHRSMSRRKSSLKSRKLSRSKSIQKDGKPVPAEGEKLIQEEKAETGEVKYTVFLAYAKALGYINAFFIMIFFLFYQIASVLSNLWLSEWTEDPLLLNMSLVNEPVYDQTQNMYLGVYGGLGAAQAGFVLLYSIVTAYSMVYAARELHGDMLTNILRSPMSFFDTTPIGRILNRFSRDVETIDNLLPQLFRSWFNTMFTVFSTIFVISFSTPLFLAVVIPLGLLYYFIQRFYIPTSRQLKRVESTTRSPIYTHFSETITGASTIRAYSEQNRFIGKSDALVDHNLVFYFASIASNRWLGVRLEFMGSCVVLAAAVFAVIGRGTISAGLVGLSISYALQVTQSLNWMVRMTSDLESNVVSVERVKEYSETPREAAWYVDSTSPPRSWPDQGKVAFENYATRYRDGLELVLKGITLNIAAGEKVGIVGRTGAGKSSLTLALFRLIESAQGNIIIDGLQVEHLGLHQLRSRLTILPQDPVLFSGTLRMNLDPFEKYSDPLIWTALEQAHLKDFVDTLPAGLDYECGEGGINLSVGQRQLVCLARTLLRKTKILILDEATAAVDLETDELIQETIRNKFSECTILTIAHRLNTIMDNDRVMVLDSGKIAEFDRPQNLLNDKASIFYAMAKDAGLAS